MSKESRKNIRNMLIGGAVAGLLGKDVLSGTLGGALYNKLSEKDDEEEEGGGTKTYTPPMVQGANGRVSASGATGSSAVPEGIVRGRP